MRFLPSKIRSSSQSEPLTSFDIAYAVTEFAYDRDLMPDLINFLEISYQQNIPKQGQKVANPFASPTHLNEKKTLPEILRDLYNNPQAPKKSYDEEDESEAISTLSPKITPNNHKKQLAIWVDGTITWTLNGASAHKNYSSVLSKTIKLLEDWGIAALSNHHDINTEDKRYTRLLRDIAQTKEEHAWYARKIIPKSGMSYAEAAELCLIFRSDKKLTTKEKLKFWNKLSRNKNIPKQHQLSTKNVAKKTTPKLPSFPEINWEGFSQRFTPIELQETKNIEQLAEIRNEISVKYNQTRTGKHTRLQWALIKTLLYIDIRMQQLAIAATKEAAQPHLVMRTSVSSPRENDDDSTESALLYPTILGDEEEKDEDKSDTAKTNEEENDITSILSLESNNHSNSSIDTRKQFEEWPDTDVFSVSGSEDTTPYEPTGVFVLETEKSPLSSGSGPIVSSRHTLSTYGSRENNPLCAAELSGVFMPLEPLPNHEPMAIITASDSSMSDVPLESSRSAASETAETSNTSKPIVQSHNTLVKNKQLNRELKKQHAELSKLYKIADSLAVAYDKEANNFWHNFIKQQTTGLKTYAINKQAITASKTPKSHAIRFTWRPLNKASKTAKKLAEIAKPEDNNLRKFLDERTTCTMITSATEVAELIAVRDKLAFDLQDDGEKAEHKRLKLQTIAYLDCQISRKTLEAEIKTLKATKKWSDIFIALAPQKTNARQRRADITAIRKNIAREQTVMQWLKKTELAAVKSPADKLFRQSLSLSLFLSPKNPAKVTDYAVKSMKATAENKLSFFKEKLSRTTAEPQAPNPDSNPGPNPQTITA
ncbi:MAG: hypothetical protein KAS93_01510 [Gammaproteobacteria bacterium]|nr:hypothetical protein [Gammaproteobacteria bacterium]